ncbi:competence protein ComEA helix-hairpin-helix repeat protein [Arthrobacter sp. FB24]|uniref:ComEA family DNA-binding protein n=1 Tax=Arthrobacter sp. (strain FB24) TaxID=290399 RepID=UPI0000527CBD|nr:ComEA family DNA-binding protein [Arthrobacter sp. FB24]ABK03625.1 competence protein ComEA helix-hairpin-helix repeat protein [Arthrobacter sp. FB24]
MSRRNAEAGAPAAASRARRRLATTLGPSGGGDGGGSDAGNPGSAGLLGYGAGVHGHGSFTYDGGAQPEPGAVGGSAADSSAVSGTHAPAKFRWRSGFRVAVLLGLLSLLLGGWFWWDVAASRPHVVPLSDVSSPEVSAQQEGHPGSGPGGSDGASTGRQPSGAASGAKIIVHVAGAVNRAGVVELPEGSRVHEAIAGAGGSAEGADLNRLNLAAVLADGQKIHVPLVGEPVDAPGAAAGATGPGAAGSGPGDSVPGQTGAEGGKIDLNSASAEELGALPRVGPVLAQRIVDWRKEHGRFSTVEELDAVDGVGPKMLETLLPLVRVS